MRNNSHREQNAHGSLLGENGSRRRPDKSTECLVNQAKGRIGSPWNQKAGGRAHLPPFPISSWSSTCVVSSSPSDWNTFFFFFFFLAFVLLRQHQRHMEVPRLGVQSELLLPAYARATAMPDP